MNNLCKQRLCLVSVLSKYFLYYFKGSMMFQKEHRLWHHSDGNLNMSFHFSEP